MLLAKGHKEGLPPKGLRAHSEDVLAAAEALFGSGEAPTALGIAWLRFFRLGRECWSVFGANLAAATLLHDLGKANDGFQAAMHGERDAQLMRHEHLSALLLAHQPMRDWLAHNPLLEPKFVISVVACHHLKAHPSPPPFVGYPEFAGRYPSAERNVLRIAETDEVHALLRVAAQRLGLPEPPEPPRVWSFDGEKGESIPSAAQAVQRDLRPLERAARRYRANGPAPDLMLPALKAALLVADSAGSGLPRTGEDIPSWIAQAFPAARLQAQEIENGILAPRRKQIQGFRERDFQRRATELAARALLIASCGTGKTYAAWRWVASQLDANPAGRAIFLYPTRGTASEGFKDYVSHAPEADAALLSATAAFELEDMFSNPDDPRGDRSFETDERLYAVGLWRKRIFSATVDQFLGFMQQVYKSACLLPVLADSVVVIDEVHSFDAGLFAVLTSFLEAFDLPVLCMTASLPVQRRARLEGLGFEVYPRDLAEFAELEAQAKAPRYQVDSLADQEAAYDIARRAVADGKRVLWVVNTVDRCQALTQTLRSLSPLCYHSRFRLEDRKERHREVVARFAATHDEVGGCIAITTQVCEMSLDLDADVLITERAPVTSLIQRMGRCHRHLRQGRPLGEVFIYEPDKERPYQAEDLAGSEVFIAALEGRQVGQARLEQLLDDLTRDAQPERDVLNAFLVDGPWARGGANRLRDTDDFTVSAVLDRDLPRWRPGADGLVLPVPRSFPLTTNPGLPRHLRQAPASHYSPALGFMKEPLTTNQDADA